MSFVKRIYDFFFFYVPYRTFLYYSTSSMPKFSAFILLLFLISSNFVSIFLIVSQFCEFGYSLFSEDKIKNRFVDIPLLLLPFVLIILLFYLSNKEVLKKKIMNFEGAAKEEKDKLNLYYWLYVIGSIFLFFLAIMSPLWTKGIKS